MVRPVFIWDLKQKKKEEKSWICVNWQYCFKEVFDLDVRENMVDPRWNMNHGGKYKANGPHLMENWWTPLARLSVNKEWSMQGAESWSNPLVIKLNGWQESFYTLYPFFFFFFVDTFTLVSLHVFILPLCPFMDHPLPPSTQHCQSQQSPPIWVTPGLLLPSSPKISHYNIHNKRGLKLNWNHLDPYNTQL